MNVSDLFSFADDLGAALAAPQPAQRVNELIRGVLIDDSEWESDEQRLIHSISERLDMVSSDSRKLLILASDVLALIGEASSSERIEMLLELIADRQRSAEVMRKYAQGIISRTGYLAFLSEQRWPEAVRVRMTALSESDLIRLTHALERLEVGQLEVILAP